MSSSSLPLTRLAQKRWDSAQDRSISLLDLLGAGFSRTSNHDEICNVPRVGWQLAAFPFALVRVRRARRDAAIGLPPIPHHLHRQRFCFLFELFEPPKSAAPHDQFNGPGSLGLWSFLFGLRGHLLRGRGIKGGDVGRSHHDQPDVSSVARSSFSHSIAPRQVRKSLAFCGALPMNQSAVAFVPAGMTSECAIRPSRFRSRHKTVGSEYVDFLLTVPRVGNRSTRLGTQAHTSIRAVMSVRGMTKVAEEIAWR